MSICPICLHHSSGRWSEAVANHLSVYIIYIYIYNLHKNVCIDIFVSYHIVIIVPSRA